LLRRIQNVQIMLLSQSINSTSTPAFRSGIYDLSSPIREKLAASLILSTHTHTHRITTPGNSPVSAPTRGHFSHHTGSYPLSVLPITTTVALCVAPPSTTLVVILCRSFFSIPLLILTLEDFKLALHRCS